MGMQAWKVSSKVPCQIYARTACLRDSGLIINPRSACAPVNPKWPHLGASPCRWNCWMCLLWQRCAWDQMSVLPLQWSHWCPSWRSKVLPNKICRWVMFFWQEPLILLLSSSRDVCVHCCDFCVCTFSSQLTASLHVKHIFPDKNMWEDCVQASTRFFRTCILRELRHLAGGIPDPPVSREQRTSHHIHSVAGSKQE